MEGRMEIPLFNDPKWDFMAAKNREKLICGLIREQFKYNKKEVPFYARNYAGLESEDLKEYNDCISKIPSLTKEIIRKLPSPYDLLPLKLRKSLGNIYLFRGTGGTTGEPTSMFFTYNDWQAILDGMVRSVGELKKLKETIIAYNGYNQGHISGPIFDDTIRRLGGFSVIRHF